MITLYDGNFSPNARKVRLLAAELALPLNIVKLDFPKGDQRAPGYLAKNPNGKVPTIDDDGFVLWESAAILRYLAGKRPERGLVPQDPKEAAQLDQWLFWWTAHPEAALWLLAWEKLIKPFLKRETDPGVVRYAEADLKRFLPLLDARLAEREHAMGPLTIADFAMAPWIESSARLDVDLAPYRHIHAWLGRLQAKPYWKDA